MSKLVDKLIVVFLVVAISVFFAMLMMMSLSLYAEHDCLSKGYPDYRISILGDRYCINHDGTEMVMVTGNE